MSTRLLTHPAPDETGYAAWYRYRVCEHDVAFLQQQIEEGDLVGVRCGALTYRRPHTGPFRYAYAPQDKALLLQLWLADAVQV